MMGYFFQKIIKNGLFEKKKQYVIFLYIKPGFFKNEFYVKS